MVNSDEPRIKYHYGLTWSVSGARMEILDSVISVLGEGNRASQPPQKRQSKRWKKTESMKMACLNGMNKDGSFISY